MQKKFTLFAVFLSFSLISHAQFQKGTITTNFNIGDIRYTGIRNKPFDKRNNLSFNPGVGYFIKNNWEVGIGLTYNSFHLNDSSHGGHYENNRSFGINIYTNYYFGKGKLKPYLTFQTGWENNLGSVYVNNVKNDFNRSYFYTGIGGGLNWNISSRFSLFTEATYRNESPFNRYYGHSRLNLTIGARYFFNRSKKH